MTTTENGSTARPRRLALGVLLGSLAAATLLIPVGCNTVEGVGRDVSAVGDAVGDTAADANPGKNP